MKIYSFRRWTFYFPTSPTGTSFYKFPVRASALAPISKTVGARFKENILLKISGPRCFPLERAEMSFVVTLAFYNVKTPEEQEG